MTSSGTRHTHGVYIHTRRQIMRNKGILKKKKGREEEGQGRVRGGRERGRKERKEGGKEGRLVLWFWSLRGSSKRGWALAEPPSFQGAFHLPNASNMSWEGIQCWPEASNWPRGIRIQPTPRTVMLSSLSGFPGPRGSQSGALTSHSQEGRCWEGALVRQARVPSFCWWQTACCGLSQCN